MLPDRVSNPEPLTYESGALPIALRGLGTLSEIRILQLCDTSSLFCATNPGNRICQEHTVTPR